ncbi:wall-associated receptor kinase-like 14 isoform X2 [Olea europaea var. sylvestris]|uniref:Wall-associated receptor kinase-like 14 n=1 Tax=Olea europaea subsp. europaea TaxID=158383 RepID=A0A8S0PJC2_OLEEU|nr:wall-associated receptor kinase-like 14 isoform X2 [Olea europaea var. sylvestris]CAA2953097.1 wall-associated receptor kinase-like 14 [Olea europaea subsp. europaea]
MNFLIPHAIQSQNFIDICKFLGSYVKKMKTRFLFQFLILCLTFLLSSAMVDASTGCNQSCGGKNVLFPFGFSTGCQIRLNCSHNGTMFINEFSILSIDSDTILMNLQAKCNRSIKALFSLFTPNYAPTSSNAILMRNCRAPRTACYIPRTQVQTNFELPDCNSKNENISCYSETNNQSLFVDYHNLRKSTCRSLFSAISMESLANTSVSLDVQIVRMGWWLQGDCQCSKNAKCTNFSSPVERKPAYRCKCNEGFTGDGFNAGMGCRKDSETCNPSKYLSGKCGGTTRVGALVGGVAAGASLMISLGLICCLVRRRSKLRSSSKKRRQLCEETGISIPVYPYKEMEKATDFFCEKRRLGNGAYGTVYSGKLHSDEWVAIKRIKHRDTGSIEQVINEIKLLSSVSHPNLVRLLGCSIENEEQILVYEYMPNGTLSQHLQREKGNGLSWPVRLTIAAETAQAISYLHNAMHPPIYHRDIKSSNILLDYSYTSKVADFGLSRLGLTESSHISTAPQGTPGYLDPQYHQHFHLSDKSDVYSLGVVLIEIITALRVVDFSRPQNEVNLAALAVDRIGKGHLDEIIDPLLKQNTDAWTLLSIHKVAELAFRCLAFHRDMRPSMMEVAIELEQIRLSQLANAEDCITASSEASSNSSSSNLSEKPLNLTVKKHDLDSIVLFGSQEYSTVSLHDLPSERSSPSSNSLPF